MYRSLPANSLDSTVVYSEELSDQARQICQALDEFLSAMQSGRAPNVEEWLAQHADIADILRDHLDGLLALQAAAGPGGETAKDRPNSGSLPFAESGTIGTFQLRREIGRGGMGIVYEAYDTALGRRVALKLLPFAAVLNHKQLARFQNEAQAASRLHHPHIVPVYSIGCDRGMNYYAMQYVDGQSLEDAIHELRGGSDWATVSTSIRAPHDHSEPAGHEKKHGASNSDTSPRQRPGGDSAKLAWQSPEFFRAAAEIGRNVALALQHAHDLGILHRDIKPSNLLLDHSGKVWITDFGLARLPGEPGMTRTGEVLGSARYMSPEQAAGQRSFVDHRSDIYSLGITLYELLTLHPAFPTDSREVFLQQVQTAEPLAPRKWNSAIPVSLEAVISKAIEKSPDRRYATALEMADDLQRCLRAEPTRAEQHRWQTWFRRMGRRHRTFLRVAAIVACLACLGSALAGGVVLRFAHQTRLALEESQRNQTRAESNYLAARQTVDQFGAKMAQRLGPIPGTEVLRRDLLEQTLQYYQSFIEQSDNDPSLLADVGDAYLQMGWIQEQLGNPAVAVTAYDAACRCFAALWEEEPHEDSWQHGLARAWNNRGLTRASLGELDAGRDDISRAVAALERLSERDPTLTVIALDLATALGNHALVLADLGRGQAASESLDQSVRLLRELRGELPNDFSLTTRLAVALHNLSTMTQQADPEHAAELAREAVDLQLTIVRRDPNAIGSRSDLILSYQHLGTLALRARRIDEATTLFRQAIEHGELLVHRAPLVVVYQLDLATCRNNLARAHLAAGENERAVAELHKAEATLQSLMDRNGRRPEYLSGLAGVQFNLGLAQWRALDSEPGTVSFQRAVELQREACALRPDDRRLSDQLAVMVKQTVQYQQVKSGTDAATLARTNADGEPLP